MRDDRDVTDADMAASNLVPARIADRLPVKWTALEVEIGKYVVLRLPDYAVLDNEDGRM